MGRRKTKGNRSPSGRRKKASTNAERKGFDLGNIKVEQRLALWAPIVAQHEPEYYRTPLGELRQIDNTADAIGQLFLLGLLSVEGYCPKALRDKGREHSRLYWGYGYGTGPSVAAYEPRTPTSQSREVPEATPSDLLHKSFQRMLRGMSVESQALFDLVIADEHSDDMIPWAEAIIKRKLLERGRPSASMCFPTDNDYELLRAAIRALCKLVDGQLPVREKLAA